MCMCVLLYLVEGNMNDRIIVEFGVYEYCDSVRSVLYKKFWRVVLIGDFL